MTTDRMRWENIAAQDINYHLRQFETPYRSTMALSRFMLPLLGDLRGNALDVACGSGGNIAHLGRAFPLLKWTGVDLAGDVLFETSRKLFEERGQEVTLISGDFYKLDEIRGGSRFELVTCIQTFIILPEYRELLNQLLAATREWLIITSPLTDFDVDVTIAATDYTWPEDIQGPHYYSVFSLPRLEAICRAHGCREFVSEPFDIDIDLLPPEHKGLGTYTMLLANGRRLQFTGPIHQPWKFVAIRM
jgi:SAM-dependent methyltransferase